MRAGRIAAIGLIALLSALALAAPATAKLKTVYRHAGVHTDRAAMLVDFHMYGGYALDDGLKCAAITAIETAARRAAVRTPSPLRVLVAGNYIGNLINKHIIGASSPCEAGKQFSKAALKWAELLVRDKPRASYATRYLHNDRSKAPDLCEWKHWLNGKQIMHIKWVKGTDTCG